VKPREDQVTIMLANTGVRLLELFNAYRAAGGTEAALCRQLGIKSRTLRERLDGRQNFTLRTLAKTCAAMGASLTLQIRHHPTRLIHTPNAPAPAPAPAHPDSLHRLIATVPLTDLHDYRGNRITAGLQRCVLHAIATCGPDWSGPARIAELGDIALGTARRALKALEAAGLITTTTRAALNLPRGAPLQAYTVHRGRLVALAAGTERMTA